LFRSVGQPPVIGEAVGGVLLGLRSWDRAGRHNFPAALDRVNTGIFAQFGVVLYVPRGPRLDICCGDSCMQPLPRGIVLPFAGGDAGALFNAVSTNDVAFSSFAVLIAMSITAFPVLARILWILGMSRSQLGVLALMRAAVDDVTAWCLLALAGVAQAAAGRARGDRAHARLYRCHFVVVRPLAADSLRRATGSPRWATSPRPLRLLVASTITESSACAICIPVHAVIPHDPGAG
jgi:hypothetical protein